MVAAPYESWPNTLTKQPVFDFWLCCVATVQVEFSTGRQQTGGEGEVLIRVDRVRKVTGRDTKGRAGRIKTDKVIYLSMHALTDSSLSHHLETHINVPRLF